MKPKTVVVVLLLVFHAGLCICSAQATNTAVQHIDVLVTSEVIHIGHSINHSTQGGITHDFWYDGCRALIASEPGRKPLLIWWCNNEIKGTPYTFSNGVPYRIDFKGSLDTGPLDQTGRCLRVTQIISSKKK
jgi:hypothetical protein